MHNITTKLTYRYGAQRNCGQVERLVRLVDSMLHIKRAKLLGSVL